MVAMKQKPSASAIPKRQAAGRPRILRNCQTKAGLFKGLKKVKFAAKLPSDPTWMEDLVKMSPNLQSMDMSYNDEVYVARFYDAFYKNTNVKVPVTELNLSYCRYLKFPSATATTFTNLKSLSFEGLEFNSKWSGERVSNWSDHCQLQILNLNGTKSSKSLLVNQLKEDFGSLQRLQCANCDWFTNEDLATIAKYCPNLKYLDVSGNKNTTKIAIKTLKSQLSKLKVLKL